jgi:hypothetical protein
MSRGVPELETLEASPKNIIYLASPYTLNGSAEENEMEKRYEQVTRCAHMMMVMGMNVFSPVTHSHAIQNSRWPLCINTTEWLQMDFAYLTHAHGMAVLMLDGWQNSIGVTREIEFCRKHHIPVMFIQPDKFILEGIEDDE